MGVKDRPYAGTWDLRQRQVIKYTPDCNVYFNGDIALPGCPRCKGRVDMQKYITQVSVDCGVDSAATSASLSLSIPLHVLESVGRDAESIIKLGLEIHIYMRGYFPMQGQFGGITPDETSGIDVRGLATYPFYHTFHGVITGVDFSYSGGFRTVSVNCGSMLHFWQFQNMSTSGSYFGARPANSGNRFTLVGNNFNKMTPYAIIYQLFRDVMGAASGVGFALSSQTNQTAKSSVLGDSLFSLAIEYWAERFSTKMMNLRMHGASGSIFNAAQAAFLGTLSTSEVEKIAKAAWGQTPPDGGGDLYKQASALRLVSQQKDVATGKTFIKGADTEFTASQTQRSGNPVGFNIATIQAYVQDIGQYGEVNLMESTYETKLEVANKVKEATGFEFYQDVDGDLVFKPPLYNLDTSSSRVYRIEDIDIIDISVSDKEPEVTYMTLKGSAFKNMKGLPTENEWGVKGQYIDYRLVAQFGWRPGSLETAYFNNSKAMFYAAINRMDIMNSRSKTASLTIPLRPEIRPGYPVYIPYLDCFYYVESMSHSFAYGSQCTTSLQLVAKRIKFYPPGVPGKEGIEAIRLDQPNYPKRPLEVFDKQGRAKLSGFPNVVMALDPNGVNPLFFVGGADLEDVSNPAVLKNIIELGRQYGLLQVSEGGNLRDGPFVLQVSENALTEFKGLQPGQDLTESVVSGVGQTQGTMVALEFTFESVTNSSQSFSAFRDINTLYQTSKATRDLKVEQIQNLENQIQSLKDENKSIKSKGGNKQEEEKSKALNLNFNLRGKSLGNATGEAPPTAKEEKEPRQQDPIKQNEKLIKQKQNSLKKLKAEVEELTKQIGDGESGGSQTEVYFNARNDPTVQALQLLVKALREAYKDEIGDTSLLDLLGDKKASFTGAQVPGTYRYFSASHPDPNSQGMKAISSGASGYSGEGSLERIGDSGSSLTGAYVTGFVQPTASSPDGGLPEAQLGDLRVQYGIRIIRPQDGEAVVPTSEIQTFSFSKHTANVKEFGDGLGYYDFSSSFSGLSGKYSGYVKEVLKGAATRPEVTLNSTIFEAFNDAWLSLTSSESLISENSGNAIVLGFLEEDQVIPSKIKHGNKLYTTDVVTLKAFAGEALRSGNNALELAQDLLVSIFSQVIIEKAYSRVKILWEEAESILQEFGTDSQEYKAAQENFQRNFNIIVKGSGEASDISKARTAPNKKKQQTFYAPVFPVSDSKGYEVYGTYRYGRGLGISGENSLRTLAFSDPLRFADPGAVEDFVKAISSGDSRIVEPETTEFSIEGESGASGRESEIIAQAPTSTLSEVEEELRKSIYFNPEAPDELKQFAGDSDQFAVGMRNWIQNSENFGEKLTVANAALLLSDLNIHKIKAKPCSCRAAEASIVLEAFSVDNIVQVVDPDADSVTQFLAQQSIEAGKDHKISQDFLKGRGVTTGGGKMLPNRDQVGDLIGSGISNPSDDT